MPVHFENDGLSPGIKRGGVLNVIRHTVEVYADPDHIPEQFIANLADLDFNDAVRWEDLHGTENTRPGDRPQLRGRHRGAADQAGRGRGRDDRGRRTGGAPAPAAAPAAAPARGAAGAGRGGAAGGGRGGGSKRG